MEHRSLLQTARPAARRRSLLNCRPAERRGYSLAAVFLLIATVGVLLALLREAFSIERIPWGILMTNVVVGLFGGTLIGGTIGIGYERRARSTFMGAGAGALCGIVGGAISIAPFKPWLVLVNCAILLALAVAVRVAASPHRDPAVVPIEADVRRVSITQMSRPRLALALFLTLCSAVALVSFFTQLRSAALQSGWSDALREGKVWAGGIVFLVALVLAIVLFRSAFRRSTALCEPVRRSPWD